MGMPVVREMIKKELAKGMSRRELSRKTKVPLASINNYLDTEMQPSVRTLERFAVYFNKPITFFFGNSGPELPPAPSPDTVTLRDILALKQDIIELGKEVGEIKTRMFDAATSGDIHRLKLVINRDK